MLSLAMSINKRADQPMPRFASDDERWSAVQRRDRAADGAFFYAVPRPENVSFHATVAAAERAGFRACKRCRPNEPGSAERQAAVVAKACRLIEAADEVPSLDTLAQAASMSRFHFHRVFKAVTGVTPKAYGDAHRAGRVRDRLTRGGSVTAAIYGAGFNSNGRFYAAASDLLGMTPTQFRGGGRGTAIRFAVGECWLGTILVAATAKGICAIELGDDPEALVRGLQDRFAHADLVGGDAAFEQWVAKVVGFIEAPQAALDLPLDIRGTAFQLRVWDAIRQVPPGSTASYTEIARRIGAPQAVRAVASACASNAIAVAIPCHRIVRRDGGVSGYRWGVERKRALLDRESAS
jgi:AraC family transcriptional regulator of adaptative response/methylated-DNA-[protein]-cysteine methyltransferase